MTIVFAILKLIGILLVVLLAIVLTLLLFVLFFPVSYRIWGAYQEKPLIYVKLYWLFHLFSYYWQYAENEMQQYLRICGIKKNLQKDISKEDYTKEDFTKEDLTEPEEKAETSAKRHKDKTEQVKQKNSTDDLKEPITEISKEAPQTSKKRGIFQRIQSIIQRIQEKLRDIKYQLLHIKDIIMKMKDILQDQECKLAFSHMKQELVLFFKYLNPRKIKLNASFSTGSPDTTGGVLGVLALFPVVYKNHWNIYPDFEAEQFYIHADFEICGRIFVFQLIGIMLRIFLDKNCRKLYYKIK